MRSKPIHFGRNLGTGRNVALSPRRLAMHTLIVGGTGSGKTVALESIARQAIQQKAPLIFLDPKGTIYPKLVNFCRRRGHGKRLHLVDPNDVRYRVGLNYFDIPVASTRQVGLVMDAIKRVMGTPADQVGVTFERWGTAALSLLAESGLTLADFHSLLVNPAFRHQALAHSRNRHVLDEWSHLESLPPRDQEHALMSSVNRAALFSKDPILSDMIGLPSSIDWQDVMANGGIVLANLGPGEHASSEVTRFIGIMLIHQIYHAAVARPRRDWSKPVYVVVDEFADVICPDFKDALQKLREFGVAMILALQNTTDLRGVDPDNPDAMLRSVIQNTETKLVLKTRDREEAEFLGRQLWGAHVNGLEVKHETTSAVPHVYDEEVETVTEMHTWGESRGYSESETSTHSESHNRSGGKARSQSAGTSTTPASELIGEDKVVYQDSEGVSVIDSWSTSSSSSRASSRSESRAHSAGGAEAVSRSVQQKMRYEYEKNPTFWSIDESLHRKASLLQKLEPGEGYLQYTTSRLPIKLKGFLSKPLRENPEAIEEFTSLVLQEHGALSPPQARQVIEGRQRKFLERREQEQPTLVSDYFVDGEAP